MRLVSLVFPRLHFFFSYLPCKGSRPRSTTLDFLPCGSDGMQFSGGQALFFGGFYVSWSGCVLEPERPHCSLPACFTPQQDMDDRPPKIRQSDPSSASRMTPGPGPFPPARPRSISPFPFGGRGPSARWPAKAGRSEWPDRHGSMPHPTSHQSPAWTGVILLLTAGHSQPCEKPCLLTFTPPLREACWQGWWYLALSCWKRRQFPGQN